MEINMLLANFIHMHVDSEKPTKKTHGYFFKWLKMYSNGQKLEVEVSTFPNKQTKIQKEVKEYDIFNLGPILNRFFPHNYFIVHVGF